MIERWNSSNTDILQAINENPELPVYFMTSDEFSYYSWTFHALHFVEVTEVAVYNDKVYAGHDELREVIYDDMCYYCQYSADDPEAEADKRTEKILANIEWEKCVLIWTKYKESPAVKNAI